MKKLPLISALLLLALSACSGTAKPPFHYKQEIPNSKNSDPKTVNKITKAFKKWQGTPYKWGGNSTRGVDCSGLVTQVYKNKFDLSLPRTSETQVTQGFRVSRNKLKVGDLVFFKTGRTTRHLGIYVGDNKFMHASSSRGVIITSLNNSYWKPKYWQARRVIK